MTVMHRAAEILIGPVWEEISSLWSGIDFAFSDPLEESVEPPEQAWRNATTSLNLLEGLPDRAVSSNHY
jgi:hypothetical protein